MDRLAFLVILKTAHFWANAGVDHLNRYVLARINASNILPQDAMQSPVTFEEKNQADLTINRKSLLFAQQPQTAEGLLLYPNTCKL